MYKIGDYVVFDVNFIKHKIMFEIINEHQYHYTLRLAGYITDSKLNIDNTYNATKKSFESMNPTYRLATEAERVLYDKKD